MHSGAAKRPRKEGMQGRAVTHGGEGEGLVWPSVVEGWVRQHGRGAWSMESALEGKRNVLKGWLH